MKLIETNLLEVLSQFPDIEVFDPSNTEKQQSDFFLCALGFEERTLAIPSELSKINKLRFDEAIYFQYETSTTENAYNEPKLLEYFKKISSKNQKLFCDEANFIALLNDIILKKLSDKGKDGVVKVMFDISVCSSRLILTVIKILFELKIELSIVYTEAKKYFPDHKEYVSILKDFQEQNIRHDDVVVLNSDFPGGNKLAPDLIISFPNFKPQRVKNIISEIDETILLKPEARLIWIIGDPNMKEDESNNRKKMMLEINEIPEDGKIYEVSTLFYKKTIEKLEHIYNNNNLSYHINIADLGSKMQTIAIGLYCLMRPEISVYNTIPKSYGPLKYSEGVKSYWMIKFGSTCTITEMINSIDRIALFDNNILAIKC